MSATPQTIQPEEARKYVEHPLGIHYGLESEQYRFARGVSVTTLHKVAHSPAHYQFERTHPKPRTQPMVFGDAIHAAIFEPWRFDRDFVRDPMPGSQSAAAKAARATLEKNGKTVIHAAPGPADQVDIWDRDDWRVIHDIREQVFSHPVADVLLSSGEPEVSMFWVDRETKRRCKARFDWYNADHGVALEFKTTDDASMHEFQRSCNTFRYFVQDAFWRDGARTVGFPLAAIVFLVAEKKPPHAVALYVLHDDWIHMGREVYRRDLRTYQRCSESGEWPTYPLEVRDMGMPRYAAFQPVR